MILPSEPGGKRARCPSCGQDNQCGFDGDAPCWCAAPDLGRIQPSSDDLTCYCRKCLERLLAEQPRPVT